MEPHPTPDVDLASIAHSLEGLVGRLGAGFHSRWRSAQEIGGDIEAINATLAAASTSTLLLAFLVLVVSVLTLAVFAGVNGWLGRRTEPSRSEWRGALNGMLAAIAAVMAGLLAAQLGHDDVVVLRSLRMWAVAVVLGAVLVKTLRGVFLAPVPQEWRRRPLRRVRLARDLVLAVSWAVAGLAVLATLRLWNAGPGLQDVVGSAGVSFPAFTAMVIAVLRHRRTIAGAVAGPRPRARWRAAFARIWPSLVAVLLVLIFVNGQMALTLGTALPGLAVLITTLILIAAPHLDAIIWAWAQQGMTSASISTAAAAWRQTARMTVLIAMLAMLGVIWSAPLAAGLGIELSLVALDALKIALVVLVTAYLWNLIGAMIQKIGRAESAGAGHEDGAAPRSRLGTLVPLLGMVGKSFVAVLGILSMLVSIGVNVWPLITGLSFFGLAVSFGSQAVVKDIVSGLFFLIDDAFRFGEYIETSGAKGTVEKISIRSVSLRDSKGPISTVPYGSIGKIQNFSRDWVIEKLTFRVALDTDVDLVRKLFRKIGEQLALDPELSKDFLQPFKSQGIAQVDDGTLVIRAKFMAKPGRQFMIRRAALAAVHKAFRENGIKPVSKPLAGVPDVVAA